MFLLNTIRYLMILNDVFRLARLLIGYNKEIINFILEIIIHLNKNKLNKFYLI